MGYIDQRGQWVFRDDARRFEDLGDFNEQLALAKIDGRWGYIDRKFNVRIAPRFEAARDFTGGLAAVKIDNKWGYINKRGRLVVKLRYDDADDFDDTLAMVKLNNRFGYIDRQGRVAIAPQFTEAEPFFRNYARVSQEPSFGYIGLNGNIIWDPREPLENIRVVTLEEDVRILVDPEQFPGHRSAEPPEPRKATPAPYPPEYLYEEQLPNPIQLRWRQHMRRIKQDGERQNNGR